jgi:hypothetical protein
MWPPSSDGESHGCQHVALTEELTMMSIVGSFAGAENDYRRELIARSWSHRSGRIRLKNRTVRAATKVSSGAPCAV